MKTLCIAAALVGICASSLAGEPHKLMPPGVAPAGPARVHTPSDASKPLAFDPPAVAYSNSINNIWGCDTSVPGWFADDLELVGGGLLTELSTSFWSWHPENPEDPNVAAGIVSAEVTIELRRADDDLLLGSFSRTLDYGPNDPLLHNQSSIWTFTGLETENIQLANRNVLARMIVNSIVYDNPDPNTHGGWGQIVYVDPNHAYCQGTVYTAVENPVGTSSQYFDNNEGHWWYGPCVDGGTYPGQGTPGNFYWELKVVELEPLEVIIDRRPEFPSPLARYWFDPAIPDFGGGSGNWRSDLPDYVPFDVGSEYTLAADPNSMSGELACLGWVFRKVGGTVDRQPLSETPYPGIIATDYAELHMLFETQTTITVVDGDNTPLSRLVTIGNRDPNDPNNPLIPLLDRRGQGSAIAPFTRYYNPVIEVPPYNNQVVVFEVDADPDTEVVASAWTRWDDSVLLLDGVRSGNMVIHRFKAAEFTVADAGPPCLERGDTNCDGLVNHEFDAFVIALTMGQDAWEALPSSTCDFFCANDINGDGSVNNGDIDPFIALLTGK